MIPAHQNNSTSLCNWSKSCPISGAAVLAILGLAIILLIVLSYKSNNGLKGTNLGATADNNSRMWQGMIICLMLLCVAGCLGAASKGR